MARIKRCDIVTINNNKFQPNEFVGGFTIREDADFNRDSEHIVAGVYDGGVLLEDSPYWYPEEVFDLAPLKKGDTAYLRGLGELRVVSQKGSIIILNKESDSGAICTSRENLYKMKSFSKRYFKNKVRIYINNILFDKLDI